MANLIRHNLIIEGPNVQRVLDFIGFKKPSALPEFNNGIVLIDLYCIGLYFDCEWPMPYGGYVNDFMGDDLFELMDDRVSFKFYTKDLIAQEILWALCRYFPAYKFTCRWSDVVNGIIGGEVLERGVQTLFVDMHCHEDRIPEVACEEPPSLEICEVANCIVLYPPATPEDVKRWYKHQEREAKRNAEEVFSAEEAK